MLNSLFAKLSKATSQTDQPTQQQEQLAFAALLVEAARSDENYTSDEEKTITRILQKQFSLALQDAIALREQAQAAQEKALDLYQFSSQIKNKFTPEEQISLIESMWEIILTDGQRDPYEDMLMRRLAGLIYLPDAELQAARRRVLARHQEKS
ncbi:MAG: tellurite resistance TerB family protein [bacterium]